MAIKTANLFESIPSGMSREVFDVLAEKGNFKIERIISKGHSSPESGWYNQEQDEWVIVLKGEAVVVFEEGGDMLLKVGDYINIPAHVKHKVAWTDPGIETIWLAVHY